MAGQVVCEMVRDTTRRGDPWFVGIADATGQRTRLTLFYAETRMSDAGELVEVWKRRSSPAPRKAASPLRAAATSSRDGAADRPASGHGYCGRVTENWMLEYQAAMSAMSWSVRPSAMIDICSCWRSPERKCSSWVTR